MKILVIAPTPFFYDRGCHVRIYEQVRFLLARGHEVVVVTYHIGDDIPGMRIVRIPNFFWYRKMGPGASLHKVYLDFFLLLQALRVARRFRPDILHCHAHEGAAVGLFVRAFFGGSLVLDSQGSLTDQLVTMGSLSARSVFLRIVEYMECYLYDLSDAVIVSNESNKRALLARFGMDDDDVHVLAESIDPDMVAADRAPSYDLRKRYGIPEVNRTIVYIGTLNELEGIEDLLDLISRLKSLRSDFVLLLMGYPNVERYRRAVSERGLGENVMVLGKIEYEELYEHLSLGDTAISLKHETTEGNGKLFNYSAIGLPIVCYDYPMNRAILGANALYLNRDGDPAENAKLFSGWLDASQELKRSIGQRARANVLEKYSLDVVGAELLSIYERLRAKK